MELRKKEEQKIHEEAQQKSVLEYNAKKKIEEREFNKKVFFEASRMQDEAEKDDAKKRKGNYPRSTQQTLIHSSCTTKTYELCHAFVSYVMNL